MPDTNDRRPCDICGGPLGYRKKRLCSPACKAVDDANNARRFRAKSRRPDTIPCVECGTPVLQGKTGRPRLFCPGLCKQRFYVRRRNRSLKGLRVGLEGRTCAECGEVFMPDRRNAVYCSQACYRRGNVKRPKFEPAERNCENCGSPYMAVRYDARFCSKVCKNREAARRRQRTPVASTRTQAYVDREIFDRDGWICHLCGKPISKNAARTNPDGATIDHIIPSSLGGLDAPENVAAAHRRCNGLKGVRAMGEQLRLT